MDVVTKAKEFAANAHRDHFRKDDAKTPYFFHLQEVAGLVKDSGGSDQEIAAAWLHDTVEDTDTTIEDIQREFGDEIKDIVAGVTDLPEWDVLSLGERKTRQAQRVAKESDSIKRVKLADQMSNVRLVGSKNEGYFTLDEKRVYLETAKGIAEVCKGISPYLDELFAERCKTALENVKAFSQRA